MLGDMEMKERVYVDEKGNWTKANPFHHWLDQRDKLAFALARSKNVKFTYEDIMQKMDKNARHNLRSSFTDKQLEDLVESAIEKAIKIVVESN